MPDMGDTFSRYITILQLIPNYPASISTTDLLSQLEARGCYVTSRSLQRDMSERISRYFPLLCDTRTKPYRWSLDRDYHFSVPSHRK